MATHQALFKNSFARVKNDKEGDRNAVIVLHLLNIQESICRQPFHDILIYSRALRMSILHVVSLILFYFYMMPFTGKTCIR